MVTILSYVERGKQPIWELTVSAAKYRSCIENEKAERTFSTISAFVVVRVVVQYRRSRDNKRCCSLHDRQFLFVHCIEQPVNMLAAVAFAVLPVRIKELVYGNIQQGDDLVKGVQARPSTRLPMLHGQGIITERKFENYTLITKIYDTLSLEVLLCKGF